MLSNQTSDLLHSLTTTQSAEDVFSIAKTYLDDQGLTHSIYLFVDGGNRDVRHWTSLPQYWVDHYRDRNYARVDPFFRYCCNSFLPVHTGPDYLADHDFLTKVERNFIVEASETGFRSGFSAPVRLRSNGAFGGWNFGGPLRRREFDRFLREHGERLALAAFCFHEHLQRHDVTASARPSGPHLTPRERECLLWLAKGIRTDGIADKLGLANVTVEFHLRNARRKLKAATREHCLVKAFLLGEIEP